MHGPKSATARLAVYKTKPVVFPWLVAITVAIRKEKGSKTLYPSSEEFQVKA